MQKLIFIFILGFIQIIPSVLCASIPQVPADSLQNLLKNNQDAINRAIVYVHLADLYADSIETAPFYWDKALTEAIKAKDEYITKLALDMLIKYYAGKDSMLVKKYKLMADESLPEKHNALFRAYLYCYNIWAEMRKNNSLESLGRELDRLKKENQKKMPPKIQIQWEYLTGVSLDYSSLITHTSPEIPNAIPYIQRALEMLSSYPLKDRIHFEELCHFELSDLYMFTRDRKAVDERQKLLELYIHWNEMSTHFKRPFLDNSILYMQTYSSMLFLTDLITKEEAQEYYEKYIQIARKKNRMDKTYEVSARYHQRMGNYRKAISYIDSALQKEEYNPGNLVPIYDTKASFYSKIGDYKNAYNTLKESNKLRKTNASEKIHQQMVEMQTRFDVNKLQLEKIKLSDKNKLIALIGVFIILLILTCWEIYQRIMVKRLKAMHKQLTDATDEARKQSIKATESEKMKTAFLNSICHEIRTPLNSINGFSQVLLDNSLDMDTKQECQQQIEINTIALTSLMDNILELSQLVSSDTLLPVQDVNIDVLCHEEMGKLKKDSVKPNVEYLIDRDKKQSETIKTNGFYLSRVIGNLLNNAIKFTETGTICLSYHIDKEKGQVIISVTDTGIGIPADKQEWVFERFTKVDDFKPGTGLGLYVCRIIIQRLGGSIRIDSDYTNGCKVIVTLPILRS